MTKNIKLRCANKKNLVWTILICITTFIICWWSDFILDRLFFGGILLLAFWFALLLLWIIYCLISIRKPLKKQNVVSIVLIAITILLVFLFPFRVVKAFCDYKILTDRRMDVVNTIKQGNKRSGEIVLSTADSILSSDGCVYILKNDEEDTIVAFWVYRGLLDSGSSMTIYSSLGEAGIKQYLPGENVTIEQYNDYWFFVECSELW